MPSTHAMAATGSSGAIVGVWAPWSGSWVAGVGHAAPGGGAKVTDDMQFRAGAGHPGDDLRRALRASPTRARCSSTTACRSGSRAFPDLTDVTLEQLCDSTSGIGSYTSAAARGCGWRTRRASGIRASSPATGSASRARPSPARRTATRTPATCCSASRSSAPPAAAPPSSSRSTSSIRSTSPPRELPARSAVEPAADGPVLSGHHSLPDRGRRHELRRAARHHRAVAEHRLHRLRASSSTSPTSAATRRRSRRARSSPEGVDRFADPLAAYAERARPGTRPRGGAIQAGSLIGQFGAVPGYTTAAFSDPTTGLTVAVVLNNSAGGAGVGGVPRLGARRDRLEGARGRRRRPPPRRACRGRPQQYHDAIAAAAICPLPPA